MHMVGTNIYHFWRNIASLDEYLIICGRSIFKYDSYRFKEAEIDLSDH